MFLTLDIKYHVTFGQSKLFENIAKFQYIMSRNVGVEDWLGWYIQYTAMPKIKL